jgi:hypothetical protein
LKAWAHVEYVKSQVYVPVLCSACLHTYLLPAASGDGLSCRDCGGAASVVPGETYGEDDLPLFERVSATVHADLTARAAQDILAELRDARGRTDSQEATLLRVADDLPGLRFLIPALYPKQVRAVHRAQIARGLGMVLTLVSARLRRFEAGSTGKTAPH